MRPPKRGSCRKVIYSSYRLAAKVVLKTDAERPYFCSTCAGYHITGFTRADFDRQQQTRYA